MCPQSKSFFDKNVSITEKESDYLAERPKQLNFQKLGFVEKKNIFINFNYSYNWDVLYNNIKCFFF